MRIESRQDLQAAIERLTSRHTASLAKFIASLAFDTGPIGEQARTFIVGDLAETTQLLNDRIEALRISSHHHHRRPGIEHDGDAMEQCGDDGFPIETAVNRATDLLAEAAKSLPAHEVKSTLQRLIAEGRYGTCTPVSALGSRYAGG